jgi:hypothetical protein
MTILGVLDVIFIARPEVIQLDNLLFEKSRKE